MGSPSRRKRFTSLSTKRAHVHTCVCMTKPTICVHVHTSVCEKALLRGGRPSGSRLSEHQFRGWNAALLLDCLAKPRAKGVFVADNGMSKDRPPSIILTLREEHLMSIGNFHEGLSQAILVGIILVGSSGTMSKDRPPRQGIPVETF